jgi:hypothetical protein
MPLAESSSGVVPSDVRLSWARRNRHILLLIAIACTFAVQARTLTFYFFQDDYVAFGEIVTHGAATYTWNLLTLNDLTPNWRVFTGLTYLAGYELFGMQAWPTRLVMVALHLAIVALLYRAVWRTTSNAWASFAAALAFGVSPAYAGTLGQLGSVTYMWAGFFLAAALNLAIECGLAGPNRRSTVWLSGSAALFACAMASNESMSVMFPVFGLTFAIVDRDPDVRRSLLRAALRTVPFAVIGSVTALYFTSCDCTAAEDTFGLDNIHRAALIYLGRLLYPIGLEPPTHIDLPHLLAGCVLLVCAILMLGFGPAIGRIGAAWMLLAIIPHALIETHTAHRFVYLATPGFSLMVGAIVLMIVRGAGVEPQMDRRKGVIVAAAAVLGAAVLPWYAWQTHIQNDHYFVETEKWRLLHDEVERVFPDVPPGTTVEVMGGPLTHPLDNFYVMPALGYTIWGSRVMLQTIAADDPYVDSVRKGANRYAAEFEGDSLVPVPR